MSTDTLAIPGDAPVRLIGIHAQPQSGGWRYDGVTAGQHVFRRGDASTAVPTSQPVEVRRDPVVPDNFQVKPSGFDHPDWPCEP